MIDGDRMMGRLDALARIGRTPRGGVTRLALSSEDTAARRQVIDWAAGRGFVARMDPIGNIFIRRAAASQGLLPVLTGSHLDTQIDGGNFDGIYGVIAGLEVLESFEDRGHHTRSPLELVIWNNEEGVRFPPVTMGSSVFAGRFPLAEVLNYQDASGVTVAEALTASRSSLGVADAPLGELFSAYVEAHIEQGPVLESKHRQIGIVTGIQGVRQMVITLTGEAAHAGTTPMGIRQDALVDAIALYARLREIARTDDPMVRFTVGRMTVLPGAPNTIPAEASFTVDLRHPEPQVLQDRGDEIVAAAIEAKATVREIINNPPVQFDSLVIKAIRRATDELEIVGEPIMSGATHDAANVARQGPAGMIFVPSRAGVSHSPRESTSAEDLIRGANVLASTLEALCG